MMRSWVNGLIRMEEMQLDKFNRVMTELEEENEMRQDLIIPLSGLRMLDDGNLFSDSYGELEVGDEAFRHLAKAFKLNSPHLEMLKNEGLTDNVADQFNHFFKNTGVGNKKKFRLDDNRVKGIVNPNFSVYDDYDLMSAMGELRETIPELKLETFYRDDKRSHARFVLEDSERIVGFDSEEDGNPDEVQTGFDIQNSEIGYGKLQINPMLYRLVCSNGMRSAEANGDAISRRHSSFSKFDLDRNIRDSVELSIQESTNTIVSIQKSKDVRINEPYKEIERIGKQERVKKDDISRLQDTFDIEPQENLFGVMNSFTRYGRILEDEENDNEGRVKFENLAGKILERV